MASLSELRILLENDFPKALELMREVAQGTRLENDLLLLERAQKNGHMKAELIGFWNGFRS